MAFLSEGVKSPCPRGVLKILVFVVGDKKRQFFVRGGSQEKVSEGGNIFGKRSWGGKIVKINCARGVKWVKKAVQGGLN